MASIRILHASDLHISRRPDLLSAFDEDVTPAVALLNIISSHSAPTKKAIVATYDQSLLLLFAQRLFNDYDRRTPARRLGQQPLDLVLLTGDLATTGLRRDLEKVRSFLEDPPPDPLLPTQLSPGYPTIAPVRDGWDGQAGIPVWILPGNHDRYRRSRLVPLDYKPGGRKFDHILSEHWGNPSHGQKWGRDIFEYPTLTQGSLNLSIIGADFNLKSVSDRSGPLRCKYAQGRVYDDILEDLVAATNDVKDDLKGEPTHVIFWAVHFPPYFPHQKNAQEMHLNEEQELIREAQRLGVTAILSGHTHVQTEYPINGTDVEVFCSGTATQFSDPLQPPNQAFRIIEVSAAPDESVTISHEHYYFDAIQSDYVKK